MLRELWCWLTRRHDYPPHAFWQEVKCPRCGHWKITA